MYDKPEVVISFVHDRLPQDLREAQTAEWRHLGPLIAKLAESFKSQITLLDIGVGNGRLIKLVHQEGSVWQRIGKYIGIDNAEVSVDESNRVVKALNAQDKVQIIQHDATELELLRLEKTPELIMCTWFTPGNFYPQGFPFESFQEDDTTWSMKENPKFTQVFMSAYNLLKPGGKLVLGSVYRDNESTRRRQEENYGGFGWEVVTGPNQSFTATRNGFWSQRFTKERIYEYLPEIPWEQIEFIELDDYEFAWMVVISKQEK